MAHSAVGDQEVFEIVDFTTASEWERFTAEVEEVLHDWQLPGDRHQTTGGLLHPGQLANSEWSEKNTVVKFADFPFNLTYHCIVHDKVESPQEEPDVPPECEDDDDEGEKLPQFLEDMMSCDNDFPSRAHCLVRWYGLREFVVLAPVNQNNPITASSKARLLQSSLAIAINNTNCQVPMFVQVHASSDRIYLGTGLGAGVRTHYDMVHLRKPPSQCTHMSGLLDVFKSKLQISIGSPPVIASVRFTYALSDWPHTLWMQSPPDFDATLTEVGFSDLSKLPCGALSDPISELQVSATWPYVNEAMLVDSECYSDLNPVSAPIWSARLITSAAVPCLLSEYLTELVSCCRCTLSTTQILGNNFDLKLRDDGEITSALDKLTQPAVPSLSTVIGQVRTKRKRSSHFEQGPIPNDILLPILNYLFPDAEGEKQTFPYPTTLSQVPVWNSMPGLPPDHPLKAVLGNIKSCVVDGIVWRLGIVISHVVHSLGGLSAAAHLWHEIILELRFRWENSFLVPGLNPGAPDLSSSLLQQKFQMLNCCIQRKKTRGIVSAQGMEEELDDEEEFFECEELGEGEESEGKGEESEGSSTSQGPQCAWDRPEGRLRRCGNLKLCRTREILFIPITQEAAPITEDKLEEQADILMRLGSDSIGSHLRALMMSSALLSDMESFKAANPGAVLEDFVRWYSPRDWIDNDGNEDLGPSTLGPSTSHSQHKLSESLKINDPLKRPKSSSKGHLSSRMQIPGNLWQEVWSGAKPVPARRQKRLFDDTREAEQVLHWLSNLKPGKLCSYLVPTVLHSGLCRLTEEPLLYLLPSSTDTSLPQPAHSKTLSAQLELIAQRVIRLSRHPFDVSKYQAPLNQLASIEFSIACAQSVWHKLLADSPNKTTSKLSSSRTTHEQSVSDKGETSPLEKLVLQLLNGREVLVDGGPRGPAGKAILRLFKEAYKASQLIEDSPVESEAPRIPSFPSKSESPRGSEMGRPVGREYLLRTSTPSPGPCSRTLPQRLFAVLQKNSFRMAGAFSEDTTFY